MKTSRPFRKKLLCTSVASVLGLAAANSANADTYEFSFVGAFTMISDAHYAFPNQATGYNLGYNDPYGWKGNRTPITGTMTYDSTAGTGTVSINGFYFFGTLPQNIALAHDITYQAIGNGTCTNDDPAQGCQPGNLFLANMGFDWNFTVGIPVTIVWDAQGLLGALPTAVPGTVIQGVGALSASDGLAFGGTGTLKNPYIFYNLGPVPVATTTWNTSPTCTPGGGTSGACVGVNPSGSLPLVATYPADFIYPGQPDESTVPVDPLHSLAGSPMLAGPFPAYGATFDLMKMTVTKVNGVSAAPTLQSKAPADGATDINVATTVTFSFTNPMQAATVTAAFSMKDGNNVPVTGTLSPASGNATNFTFTPDAPLAYSTAYTATITDAAQDSIGQPLSGAPIIWGFTTAAKQTVTACTPVAQKPLGSNFTMLNPGGVPFGGTNDVSYTLDLSHLNTTVSGPTGMYFNATLSSPTPFFSHTWKAHDIRVFGPGSYDFNIDCSVAQIESGTCTPNADPSRNMHMTVGQNQLGAHMLFDWNVSTNIDVVNVWDQNSAWNSNPVDAIGTNDLWSGPTWAGPAGLAINPSTTWAYVSTDNDGDNINGVRMLDGPFQGFSANFNLDAADSCQGVPPTPIDVGTITSASATGCSISNKPSSITVFDRSDWLLLGGFLAWLGALRKRSKRQTQS